MNPADSLAISRFLGYEKLDANKIRLKMILSLVLELGG